MAETIADYERWKARQQQSGVGAANVVLGTVDAAPDEIAADLTTANEFSKVTGAPVPPSPLVREYRGVFQQKIDEARNSTILSSSPRLTEWLRNPENAALARDDLQGLSWWEAPLAASGNAISRGVRRIPQSYNQYLANEAAQTAKDQQRSAGEILSDQTAIRGRDGEVLSHRNPFALDVLLGAGSRWATARLADALGTDERAAAAYYQQQAGQIAKRISEIPMSEAGDRFRKTLVPQPGADVWQQLSTFTTNVGNDLPGFLAFLGEVAIESAPQLATAIGVTLATRSPAAGAVTMGGQSFAVEYGTSPVEFFREKKIDVSTPEGAMRVISDPALMREAAERGVIRGTIIGAMDGLSGGIAGKQLAASPIGNMALQAVTQAVMGSAGEAGAQLAAGQEFNLAEVLIEGLAEFVTAPVEVAGVGGRAFLDARHKARDAEARQTLFQEISGQAVSSKLRERMPDRFRQFVEAATANGPVENVYVPAGEFVTYFQGLGVDPYTLVDELDGVTRDDLDVALAGGGDLQIPTATYAAKIAGSEHDAFLMENMRFDPDQFTAREAAEFNARAQDALEEAYQVAEAVRQEQDELRSFEQEIYDTMVSQLRAAGRSTDVATTEAMLYPAFYRVMAERSGMMTEEFMRVYPLPKVAGDLPQGMQFRDVDTLNRTLAEARARRTAGLDKRGPTLLEFISDYGGITDPGGELRARDAEVIRRGRGKKSLKLARRGVASGVADMFGRSGGKKYGADDVARAAIEAGYMTDDPDVMEYRAALAEGREVPDISRALWASIDAELRGEPQRAADRQADARADIEAQLDQIEAYLAGLGVSLDDDDAAIRAAIEADQAGRQYAQPALPDPASSVKTHKSGAGDASIDNFVDLDGKPEARDLYDAVASAGSIDQAHLAADRWVFERGKETGVEFMAGFDNAGGLMVAGRGSKSFVAFPPYFSDALGRGAVQYATHNHPRNTGLSGGDIAAMMFASLAGREKPSGVDMTLTAMGSAGSVATAGPGPALASYTRERTKIGSDVATVEHTARAFLQDLVRRGELTTDIANAAHAHVSNLTLHKVGIIDLRGNGPQIVADLGIPIDKAFEGKDDYFRDLLRRAGFEFSGFRDFDSAARAGGLAEQGATGRDADRVSAESAGTARGRKRQRPDDPRQLKLFQSGGPGPRGSIQFPGGGVGNGDTVIRLFETADLSTFLHESGHYFLTVMRDLAMKGEGQSAQDFSTVKAWWRENAAEVAKDANRVMPDAQITADDVIAAIDTGSTGDVLKDAAVDVGMQEQWARGFETYLMEGKAPSADLRSAFEKFRAWLISIYKRLAGLNVTVSDDIRAVFDRMIATDDEIAAAKAESGDTSPIFATAESMGLTQEEYDAFLKLRTQAEEDAKARLLRETMAPIKRAQEKWFKDERAAVQEEVAREVNTYRYYRAMEWMGNRRWLGDGQPDNMPDMRMSKDILIERYGEGVLKTLPRGKQTVYALEGGLDPDEAAGWFGFDSGDEMIRAMERAPKRTEAIEAETDRVMRDRHGDPLTDGSIEAAALDAVHTDKRGQWIAAELKAITEIAGTGGMLTAKEARATARTHVSRMRVRDAMNANRFLAAERRAADEAARLGAQLAREKIWLDAARRRIATTARRAVRGEGEPDTVATAVDAYNERFETTTTTFDVPERSFTRPDGRQVTMPGGQRTATSLGYNDLVAKLVEAKRRQLLNHALYSEARKVADEVEKAENFVAKLGKASTRERIAGAGRRDNAQVDYLAAIDEILERYDFRRLSGTAEQRRGALNAFVETMKAAGRENELAIPETVLADAARKPYKTLPVEELRGVVASLKNLEHIALRWNKLIEAQRERELDTVTEEITAAFDVNVKKRPPGRVRTTGEGLRNAGRQFLDLVLNAGTILREIDGFADFGAAYRNIKSPIDEAMNRLITRKQQAATDLENLYAVYSKADRRRMAVREHIPELGYALSKWERIAVALNTGNDGNRTRLTDPKVRGSLTDDQVSAVLATLDERDADFVQSVWDYVGSFRSDIGARERRVTGVEPEWIEASPVEIAGKTLRGGYYPLKYDPRLSSLARDDETQDIAQALQAGRFGKAQTKNGHLKARAQSSGRDIELDMSVLHRHVNQVIYDIELSEPVANSWRILQDGRVRGAFIEAGKQADFDALETWLKDVAEGELRSADLIGRTARMMKSNFTAAKLAFNLVTVAMQVTGLAQTMVVTGKKDFVRGLTASIRNGVRDEIAGKSAFMSSRQTTFNKDIYDFYSDPLMGPVASRWGDIKSEILGPLSFWLMTKIQWHMVDVPAWLAGYEQGLRKFGNDETQAIAHADAIVKRAQASGLFSDRSAIERGSVSRTARQNDVVRLFTALGSYMFAKFNVAYERSAVAQRTIRDEGLSLRSTQEALSWTLDMAFLFTVEAVLVAAIKGKLPDDDDEEDPGWLAFLAKQTALSAMATVPIVRDIGSAFEGFGGGGSYGAITKELSAPIVQITQGEVDKAAVKSVINATGLMTGLPSTQINRAVDAAWRQVEGEDVSPIEYLMGRRKK